MRVNWAWWSGHRIGFRIGPKLFVWDALTQRAIRLSKAADRG